MALLLKSDVLPSRKFPDGTIARLQAEILLAIIVAQGVFEQNGIREMMVTALLDGTHSTNSLHYKGRAVDIRTKGTGMAQRLFEGIRKALPETCYDVLLEDKDQPNEHIHIEAQNHAFE